MADKPTIAITMTGHNEAHLLPQAMENLGWADELIYVDCESADDSLEVARRYTTRIFERPNTTNLNVNKAHGIAQATADWVFYLDPDEVISPELAAEIQQVVASNPQENAFELPRRNHFFGKWLRHGGQYPDIQLRLFRRGKAHFPCKHVHERLEVQGKTGRLKQAMDHFTIDSPMTAVRKMDFFSTFNAQAMARSGRRPGFWLAFQFIFFKPSSRFIRRFFFKGGFLDGFEGFIQATITAVDFAFRYFKFWYLARHPEALPPLEDIAPPGPEAQQGTAPGEKTS